MAARQRSEARTVEGAIDDLGPGQDELSASGGGSRHHVVWTTAGSGKSHAVLSALLTMPIEEQRFAVLLLEAIGKVAEVEHGSESDVRRLIFSMAMSGEMQRARADELRSELAQRLTPSLAELDPVPRAAIRQATRLAELKTSLLESGAYSIASLAEARGLSSNAIRQWLHRTRRRNEIFTVSHDGETLVPAFLLDDELHPWSVVSEPIRALREAGEDGWALWAWFALPAAALGGVSPAHLLAVDPDRVAELARRRAAEAA